MSALREQDPADSLRLKRDELLSDLSDRRTPPRRPRPLTSFKRRLAPNTGRVRESHQRLATQSSNKKQKNNLFVPYVPFCGSQSSSLPTSKTRLSRARKFSN